MAVQYVTVHLNFRPNVWYVVTVRFKKELGELEFYFRKIFPASTKIFGGLSSF